MKRPHKLKFNCSVRLWGLPLDDTTKVSHKSPWSRNAHFANLKISKNLQITCPFVSVESSTSRGLQVTNGRLKDGNQLLLQAVRFEEVCLQTVSLPSILTMLEVCIISPDTLAPHCLVETSVDADVRSSHLLHGKLADLLDGPWGPSLETPARRTFLNMQKRTSTF